jgi:hypothetical protein
MLVRIRRKRNPYSLLMECKSVQSLWKSVWQFLKKLKIELPYDLAVQLLKESKFAYYRDTCIAMFIPALVTIAKLWNQPHCSSTDEWIKKMWHIYTVEFYLTMRKNEIRFFVGKWIELEIILLSEISQSCKYKCSMFFLMCGI